MVVRPQTLTAAVDGELGIFDDGVERLREGVVEGRRADECVDVGESVRVAVYCTLKQSELIVFIMVVIGHIIYPWISRDLLPNNWILPVFNILQLLKD